ncbi:MAG: hypothetical protein CM1200mP39_16860 [Dehalococcoidia bacterium]|nr:MAG: hypothetical protein CM1200mP39_16860 [Dehalococcoidia bacterium]
MNEVVVHWLFADGSSPKDVMSDLKSFCLLRYGLRFEGFTMTNNVLRSGAFFWRRSGVFFELSSLSTLFLHFLSLSGDFYIGRGWPDYRFCWVIFAMVSMRTFGMPANRLIDEDDSRNPRTAMRAIPAGEISRLAMYGYMRSLL